MEMYKGVSVRPESAALGFHEEKKSNPAAGKMQTWRCTKECPSDRSQQRWFFMRRRNAILLLIFAANNFMRLTENRLEWRNMIANVCSRQVVLNTNKWYHSTRVEGDDISITIGSEYD
ncbi:hypothetical protein PoB_005191700 [Plakobranchus ocellatus]|uniref:Uncharacterized protein n=1 Tax=Plakobranchus ocellatus TaxID=259542 RepID=A0AAV4C2B4_9GAST|nr:hypothetical protein PoB_005191700 [Plakobranchus ocellatus]